MIIAEISCSQDLRVQLMLFFSLLDIIKVQITKPPPGDF